MASEELVKKILLRLFKLKFLIIIGGVIMGVLAFFYAKKTPIMYSVKSTIFPLTPSSDKNNTTSKISELLGGGGGTKNITEDATVNIEEVGRSKKTREAVAIVKLPEFNNLTVAEVLINESNNHKSFFTKKIEKPNTQEELATVGADILKDFYTVKFNKNSLLEIVFSSYNNKLVPAVSYVLIDKISQFYKELKIEKAQLDFDFASKKVDSLENLLAKIDNRRINLNNTSVFVPAGRMKFTVPIENLENIKIQVAIQKNNATANKDDAMYRLDKITPIIQILDKPTPPFDLVQTSSKLYAIIGFVFGCIFFSILFIAGILIKFANNQLKTTIAKQIA